MPDTLKTQTGGNWFDEQLRPLGYALIAIWTASLAAAAIVRRMRRKDNAGRS